MSSPDHKKTGVAFWAIVVVVAVIVVLVGYPLSWGPICWLHNHNMLPACVRESGIYSPMRWVIVVGPEPIQRATVWYLRLWDW